MTEELIALQGILQTVTDINNLLINTVPVMIFMGGFLIGCMLLQAFSFWKW